MSKDIWITRASVFTCHVVILVLARFLFEKRVFSSDWQTIWHAMHSSTWKTSHDSNWTTWLWDNCLNKSYNVNRLIFSPYRTCLQETSVIQVRLQTVVQVILIAELIPTVKQFSRNLPKGLSKHWFGVGIQPQKCPCSVCCSWLH